MISEEVGPHGDDYIYKLTSDYLNVLAATVPADTKLCEASHCGVTACPPCCGQPGGTAGPEHTCPAAMPLCTGYVFNKSWGGCGPGGMAAVAVALDDRSFGEAPAVFKRAGWYYWGTADFCGYCAAGGGAYWWKSKHPLGPYVFAAQNTPVSGRFRLSTAVFTASSALSTTLSAAVSTALPTPLLLQ